MEREGAQWSVNVFSSNYGTYCCMHCVRKNSATNKVMLNNAKKVGELVLCRTSCFLHSSEMERKYY
jgi:hypothetical protein